MQDYIQVLVSIDGKDKAHELQRLILEHRAAACVQVLGPISSAHRSEGHMDEAQEWLCRAETNHDECSRLWSPW
jgi:periplasmic divalent cation tolerance protein